MVIKFLTPKILNPTVLNNKATPFSTQPIKELSHNSFERLEHTQSRIMIIYTLDRKTHIL